MVTMPVCNYDGEVIGVAQIMNKIDAPNAEFVDNDLKTFERYLTFGGVGIQNAQLFEVSILEYKKNKVPKIIHFFGVNSLMSVISIYSFSFIWPKVYLKNK